MVNSLPASQAIPVPQRAGIQGMRDAEELGVRTSPNVRGRADLHALLLFEELELTLAPSGS
jgi:hypothetical protein